MDDRKYRRKGETFLKNTFGYFRNSSFAIPAVISLFIVGMFLAFTVIPFITSIEYSALSVLGNEKPDLGVSAEEEKGDVFHVKTPSQVKALYMTSCVAGTPSFRQDLVSLAERTELNSIIIDIKDYTGKLSFFPEDESLKSFVSDRCRAPDMKEFIKTLHSKGIYVIGRITVFQDPYLAKLRPDLAVKKRSDMTTWKDYKGLSFTDPGSKEVWDHAVKIGKESYALGFDELNFDYIRFPSDGPMKDIYFSWSDGRQKSDVLEDFFSYLHDAFEGSGAVLSADLFGMTTSANNGFDLNIGQVWEKALPYFDYLSPMIYPSHYPPNWNGYADPNKYPYEIIKTALDDAVRKTVATTTTIKTKGSVIVSTSTPVLYSKPAFDPRKVRPWIQDFDYGGNYDIAEVKAQIQATYDAGLDSWMLWAPSNRYTEGALKDK